MVEHGSGSYINPSRSSARIHELSTAILFSSNTINLWFRAVSLLLTNPRFSTLWCQCKHVVLDAVAAAAVAAKRATSGFKPRDDSDGDGDGDACLALISVGRWASSHSLVGPSPTVTWTSHHLPMMQGAEKHQGKGIAGGGCAICNCYAIRLLN